MTTVSDTNAGAKGYRLGPGEGVPGFGADTKASRGSTGGSLAVIESNTRGGAPMHVHHQEDESFYVVKGSITVQCGDQAFEAGPGAFVFLPHGIPHAWDVTGNGFATVLIITVPGGIEEFLREYHEAGAASNEIKDQIAARHGIEWVRKP
jgi:mannose-6-phosphate isomerase-like protein (cupin superfamily)